MAIGVKALPITFVAHAVAIVAAIMVLVWCLGFRGGLAWEDTNKNLIFNVSSFLFWVYGILMNFSRFFFFIKLVYDCNCVLCSVAVDFIKLLCSVCVQQDLSLLLFVLSSSLRFG